MDFKIKFEKIQNNKYLAKLENTDILTYVSNIVNDISLGEMDSFLDVNNDSIIETLLARIIGAYFYKDKTVEHDDNGFSIIMVEIGTIKLRISVSRLSNENNKLFKLTGVMESN